MILLGVVQLLRANEMIGHKNLFKGNTVFELLQTCMWFFVCDKENC
jgi:hypothetical protein